MWKLSLLLLFSLIFLPARSQDILVMRQDEKEIKCTILSLNDNEIIYRLWKSTDQVIKSVKRSEVMSFMVENPSKSQELFPQTSTNDSGLLGEYHIGSVVSGYIIKMNSDTVEGSLKITNMAMNQVEVNFTDKTGHSTHYTTSDLKGYGYHNIQYEKITTGYKGTVTNNVGSADKIYFVHRAIDGPSKLYRFYTLNFEKSLVKSYENNPPFYLGKLKRHFIITTPGGKSIFTKGRTIKGSLNRAYFDYKPFHATLSALRPGMSELPGIVNNFNTWFESQ